MNFAPLADFSLVGGTALSLQFGHRVSIDLDLFTETPFDIDMLKRRLTDEFKNANLVWQLEKEYSLLCLINDIKVDMLYYPYPLIDNIIIEEDVRMLSPKDISAMKLSEVSNRGAKKDFFDIYELMQQGFSLADMFLHYKEKFPNAEISFVVRSLLYFDDAELEEDPIMLKDYSWEDVKNVIVEKTKEYIEQQL